MLSLRSRMEKVESDLDVHGEVYSLLTAYAILLLQWRGVHPNGSALDWLLFQTKPGYVDEPLTRIQNFLNDFLVEEDLAQTWIEEAAKLVKQDSVLLVVDEAQILAERGSFPSTKTSTPRSLLFPFVRALDWANQAYWLSAPSLSLIYAIDVPISAAGKVLPFRIKFQMPPCLKLWPR